MVDRLLELVREGRHSRRAEESRQPLQGVDGAEDIVDEARIEAVVVPNPCPNAGKRARMSKLAESREGRH